MRSRWSPRRMVGLRSSSGRRAKSACTRTASSHCCCDDEEGTESVRIRSMTVASATNNSVHRAIERDGFAFVHGRDMRALLAPYGTLRDWTTFAESWNYLELDTYMADGGRYRRRRHAVFSAKPN